MGFLIHKPYNEPGSSVVAYTFSNRKKGPGLDFPPEKIGLVQNYTHRKNYPGHNFALEFHPELITLLLFPPLFRILAQI